MLFCRWITIIVKLKNSHESKTVSSIIHICKYTSENREEIIFIAIHVCPFSELFIFVGVAVSSFLLILSNSHILFQTPSPLSLPSLSESDDDSVELNYYICMVHHGKTMDSFTFTLLVLVINLVL